MLDPSMTRDGSVIDLITRYRKILSRSGAIAMSGSYRTFKYVLHRDRTEYEALGWVAFDLGLPHGIYSVGMEWCGEGEPRYPKGDELVAEKLSNRSSAICL